MMVRDLERWKGGGGGCGGRSSSTGCRATNELEGAVPAGPKGFAGSIGARKGRPPKTGEGTDGGAAAASGSYTVLRFTCGARGPAAGAPGTDLERSCAPSGSPHT